MVPVKQSLAIVGVGNTLAGDDGAGIEVVRRLRSIWDGRPGVLFHTLEGDHFEVADLLERAEQFIFVDAFAGDRPGLLVSGGEKARAFSPSFHQTDVAAVMHFLETLGTADPFPSWEVMGITIIPPTAIGEGLTPEVEEAVERLCALLCAVIEEKTL